MAELVGPVSQGWNAPAHLGCDASCPDCLRSWDHQWIHPYLDWRLALDVAHLLLGDELSAEGRNSLTERTMASFHYGFKDILDRLRIETIGGFPALVTPEAVALVAHPLYPRRGDAMLRSQRDAELRAGVDFGARTVAWTDPRELRSRPDAVFSLLAGERR